MSILDFIQIVLRNKVWVIYFPLAVGIGVWFNTHKMPHTYDAESVIYTGIASGFNPDNDFENKIDFHAVNSRFDNLINIISARETRKDVGVKLLAYFMHHDGDRKTFLENEKNDRLSKFLDSAFIRKFRKEDEQATEEFLDAELIRHPDSAVYQLVYGEKKSPFNIKTLADIKAEREGFSDMLKLNYTSEDPLACKKSLDLITEIFLKKYQLMRIGEADQAVKYFRNQTDQAQSRLKEAEDKLKYFKSTNGVINYYEQTKYIADEKENMDKDQSELEMELNGYQVSIARLEQQMSYKVVLELQSQKIVQAQNDLAQEISRQTISAIKGGSNPGTTAEIEAMKKALKDNIDNLYAYNNTKEGVPSKNLLEEWLKLTISKEETEAKLNILTKKKSEFGQVFDKYAPIGSDLTQLERAVETNEKEYLNLLHSLNQAILRVDNLKASESVTVIDPAEMPSVPNPSKRIMLVVASMLSCIILAVVILVVSSYLDSSLGSPLRLEKALGFGCGSAFISRKLHPEANAEMDHRSLDRWAIALNEMIRAYGTEVKILSIPFNCSPSEMDLYISKLKQTPQAIDCAISITTASNLHCGETGACLIACGKVFAAQLPKEVLDMAKGAFLFFDATQKLDDYQMQLIEQWKKSGISIKGILINTNEQNITKYLGEIPRKRSRFRTFAKRIIKRYANG